MLVDREASDMSGKTFSTHPGTPFFARSTTIEPAMKLDVEALMNFR